MAFRLKNGGATYQKCVHIILEPQIGRNGKAYIDNMVVKSKKHGDLLDDLKETFNNFCMYKMMPNPKNVCSVCHQEICSAIWSRPGNRCEPEECGSHRTIATTSYLKRNPEVGRHDGITQLIHILVG
jgi:hypothetical protein